MATHGRVYAVDASMTTHGRGCAVGASMTTHGRVYAVDTIFLLLVVLGRIAASNVGTLRRLVVVCSTGEWW